MAYNGFGQFYQLLVSFSDTLRISKHMRRQ